jgi:hypothetical protein
VKTAGAVGAGLLWLASAGGAAAREKDPIAEGRYFLRKANALAGDDHCAAAIKDYTLAYQRLHDPVVLFNRAECHRRVGDAAAAVTDYRAFLEAVPAAPSRAQIEAKIAALEAPRSPPPAGSPAPTSPPASARLNPPPVAPPDSTPVIAPQPPVAVAETVPLVMAPAVSEPTASSAPPVTEGSGNRIWYWAALGAVVAGGAAAAYFVLRTPGATPPATDLGNYRF